MGNYDIVCSGASDNNYSFAYVKGTLTVNKKQLTVTADDQTITYGQADPTFTFSYSGGFVGTDSASDINTPPTCGVSGAHSNVGNYDIVCSGASDNNYSFAYVKGTLTVNKKQLPAPRPRPLTRASAYHATMSVIAATTGSTVTAVGTVHGLTPPGGIIVLHSPQGAEVTETYTYYDGLGTISGSFRLVRTPQPDGTLTLTTKPGGTAHGTGRYARVTGLASTSFNGSRDPTTGVVTITLTGRLRLSP